MSDSPAWIRYWGDKFMGGIIGWSAEEVGAYWLLLNAQLQEGSIPNDVNRLARIAAMDRAAFEGLWTRLLRFKFEEDPDNPGVLRNPRMVEERERAVAGCATRTEKARKAARARWNAPSNAPGTAGSNAVGQCSTGSGSLSSSESSLRGESARGGPAWRAHLDTLETTAGLPPWTLAILREYGEHAEDPQSRARCPGTVKSWTALGRAVETAGEERAREALGQCLAADGETLQGWLRAVADQAERGKTRADREAEERAASAAARAEREMEEAERKWEAERAARRRGEVV